MPGETSNFPEEVIFINLSHFYKFPYQPLFYLPRHRFAEKSAMEIDELLQKLMELTGTDPGRNPFLRILLKQNIALLSTVRLSVSQSAGVTSHISHIYKGINAMLLISRGPIKPTAKYSLVPPSTV